MQKTVYALVRHCAGCVLTHNGCHYIANHPGLLQHLGLLLSSEKQNSLSAHECQDLTPALIGFSESGRLELNLLGTDHVQVSNDNACLQWPGPCDLAQ